MDESGSCNTGQQRQWKAGGTETMVAYVLHSKYILSMKCNTLKCSQSKTVSHPPGLFIAKCMILSLKLGFSHFGGCPSLYQCPKQVPGRPWE